MTDQITENESVDNSNRIEAAEKAYLYIDVSKIPDSGMGLFTAIKIFKEEIIAVFKGENLTEAQAKRRVKKNKDQYFIMMPDGSILDSMKKNCFAKYANDANGISNSEFTNNANIELDENEAICLIAKRNIKKGEEIFCNYGKRYWMRHGKV